MTYSEAQARAMVRAAAITARELPEAAIETVVASVLREVGQVQAGEAAAQEDDPRALLLTAFTALNLYVHTVSHPEPWAVQARNLLRWRGNEPKEADDDA